jgi:hypothetical protein
MVLLFQHDVLPTGNKIAHYQLRQKLDNYVLGTRSRVLRVR